MATRILTINTGSSSLKAGLYRIDRTETLEVAATAERIGKDGGRLRIADASGASLLDRADRLSDHAAAVRALLDWLRDQGRDRGLVAIGHRIVHGGAWYREPRQVEPQVIEELARLIPIDPEHLPQAIDAVRAVGAAYPEVPQVACFDTAFHARMPRIARIYALPRALSDEGIVRYGFHGLSYEFIVHELRRIDPVAADGRLVIAHLGNGASMAAVRGGIGVDTTMGFTPTGGLVMGTRVGDLDPGVLLYLLRSRGLDPDRLSDLVNRQSGLLGVSETSEDMADLLAKATSDPRAAEAVELFCYQARKFLGALATVLGGLDTLVFTGGIGERGASIRQRICAGLDFLGIQLDPRRNDAHQPIVSGDGSPVTVRVIKTDEDLMIARHTKQVIGG